MRANTDIIQELQWESRGQSLIQVRCMMQIFRIWILKKLLILSVRVAYAPTSVDLPQAMHAYSLITEEQGVSILRLLAFCFLENYLKSSFLKR